MRTTHARLIIPIRLIWILAAFFTLGGRAVAETVKSLEPAGELPRSDRNFIEQAALAGMKAVAISQIVVDRTLNAQIKSFAQTLVDDHNAAAANLNDIAASKKVSLPTPLGPPRNCPTTNGKDFDENFLEKIVSDQEDAVKLFTEEASAGHDQEIIEFARTNLPTLQRHLDQARELQKVLK